MDMIEEFQPGRRFDRWGLQGETIEIVALRGPIGGRERYLALVSLDFLASNLSPAEGAREPLDSLRVHQIAASLLERPDEWVLGGVVASFEPAGSFVAEGPDDLMGILRLPLGTRFTIEDGRHRQAAIRHALREAPRLAQQTIAIELFPFESRERSARISSTLNQTVIPHDPAMRATIVAQAVMEAVPVFGTGFVTLHVLSDASADLLAAMESRTAGSAVALADATAQVIRFWAALAGVIPQWAQLSAREMTIPKMRSGFVCGHAVVIRALAVAGRSLVAEQGVESMRRLAALRDIDWARSNPDWQGVCMVGDRVVTRRRTREDTARLIESCIVKHAESAPPTPPEERARAGARLAALNMALTGMSRAETDVYLRENFELDDTDGLLAEVFATATG